MPNKAQQPSCVICQRSVDEKNVVYRDEHWIVRHSNETNILGYFLIESARHFLDLSLAEDAEVESYGRVLRVAMGAIKEVVDYHRLYTFSLAEAVPHYHLHLIPRTDSMPKAYRGRGVMQYPLEPAADQTLVDEVCSRVRRAIARGQREPKITSLCR